MAASLTEKQNLKNLVLNYLFIEPQIEKSPGAGVCLPEQVSQEFPCMGLSCDDQVGYQRATFGALEQFGMFPVRFNVQQTQQFELQRHKLIPFIKSTHLPHMAGFGTYLPRFPKYLWPYGHFLVEKFPETLHISAAYVPPTFFYEIYTRKFDFYRTLTVVVTI